MKLIKAAKYNVRVALALKEFFTNYSQFVEGISYFPEYKNLRKSKTDILRDQLSHIFKYSYCNNFYFLYGFDIKGLRNEEDYVDYTIFMRQRNLMNQGNSYSLISILRDKALFDLVASKYGFNTPKVLGLVTEDFNFINYEDNSKIPLVDYLKENKVDAYLKVIDGECADGIFHIITNNSTLIYSGEKIDVESFVGRLPNKTRFILQQKMSHQHPAISAIHPKAVNTIRLVTVMDPSTNLPVVFSAVLRVGVRDNEVDNWAAGGLSIGIDTESQTLRKYGFYKPGYGTKSAEHPDTHIVFEGYKIPFLQEAIDEAIRFHKMLPSIHSIGWDIAITEEGPCFIEGNDNWEISLMQISNNGLQIEFNKLFYK